MKKLALLLLIAVLLAGCQTPATPQPTPASVEALAGSTSDLVGVWWFTQASALLEFKADGTYRVYTGSETLDEGNYTFDAGKVTWVTGHPTCNDQPATYQAYVTKQNGKPAWLRMQAMGSDPCSGRAGVLAGNAKFQSP
jgi:hypothetical protein